MTTTVEQTFIVGNYPMLHPIPEKDYDPWRFELSSIGKWTLWNTTTSADDLTTNTSIVSGGGRWLEAGPQGNAQTGSHLSVVHARQLGFATPNSLPDKNMKSPSGRKRMPRRVRLSS